MAFMTGNFPPVDPATFMDKPYRERLKTLAGHWAEYGFGSPKVIMVMYLLKLVFFYALGGVLVGTLTSHLNPLHPSAWFFEPIFYEKAVLWTVLLECLGFAGSWGPLAGHFKPMSGGIHYYARPGTIRLAPWPDKVPFTNGDERTARRRASVRRAAHRVGRVARAARRSHARDRHGAERRTRASSHRRRSSR